MAYDSGWLGTSNQYIQYKLVVTDRGEDVVNNTSLIDITIYMRRTNTGYTTYRYWGFTAVVDGTTYSVSPGPYAEVSTTEAAIQSWSGITIPHNSDGTKTLGITVSMNATYPGSTTYTAGPAYLSFTLPDIARKSTITLPATSVMGQSLTISIQAASSGFTHRLSYAFGNVTGEIASGVNTSQYPWNAPPVSLAAQIPKSNVGVGTVFCETFSGGVSLGYTEAKLTLTVPDSVRLDVSDGWVTLSPYSENATVNEWELYIKNCSGVKAVFDGGHISYDNAFGATIVWYQLMVGGSAVSSNPYKLPYFTAAGNITVTASVIDSRGNWVSRNFTVTVEDYAAPAFSSKSVVRCDENGIVSESGTYLLASANILYHALGNRNVLTIKARYKPVGGAFFADTTLDNGLSSVISGGIQVNATYIAQIVATDAIGNSTPTFETTIPTADAALNFRPGGKGARFGGYAQSDDLLQVDWDMKVGGNVTLPNAELVPAANSGHGGYLDFHFNGDQGDYTSRIIEDQQGILHLKAITEVDGLRIYGVRQPYQKINTTQYRGSGGNGWHKLIAFRPTTDYNGCTVRVRGYSTCANLDGRGHFEILLSATLVGSTDFWIHSGAWLTFGTRAITTACFHFMFTSDGLCALYFSMPQYTVYYFQVESVMDEYIADLNFYGGESALSGTDIGVS